MTQVELKYMSVVPNELREIREQLEALNKSLATIAKILNERK